MNFIKYLSILVILGVVGIFLAAQFLFIRIELGEVGVRTQQYAFLGEKGVVKKDFAPGWHRNLPLLDSWNTFDSTVQTTEFTTAEERMIQRERYKFLSTALRSSSPSVGGPEQIELKSKDGYTVKLDVTVKYRITPGEAHSLYRQFNTEARYKGIVGDQVQETIRGVFGLMLTEEFYNPNVRRVKTDIVTEELSVQLKKNHIELVGVLIRDIAFDPSYERKILDKKLADQDVELNKSRALAEEKKGLTNTIAAETEAKVRVIEEEMRAAKLTLQAETNKQMSQIQADSKYASAKLKADADLYAAEASAKGQLLEKQAEAEGERLKAVALNTAGGNNLVALELVQSLQLDAATVSTLEVDFLDVDAMVDKLGAE